MYGQRTPTASGTTLADVRNKLTALQEMKRSLLNSATRIFQLHRYKSILHRCSLSVLS